MQLGVDKETGQKVAIKTIRKAKIETEADLIRVRREIQIMSSVQHPNIIHIYEGKSQHCFLPGAFINLSPPCAVNRTKQLRKEFPHFVPLTHYCPAMPFGNRKFILEDLFSSTL